MGKLVAACACVWILGCVGEVAEDAATALDPPIVVDNDEVGFRFDGAGDIPWTRAKGLPGLHGDYREIEGGYLTEGRFRRSGPTAEWRTTMKAAGRYIVHVWYPPDAANTPRAQYGLLVWARDPRTGAANIVASQHWTVDQRRAGADDGWQLIGEAHLETGDTLAVELRPYVSDPGRVIADAVRFTRVSGPLQFTDPPAACPYGPAADGACLVGSVAEVCDNDRDDDGDGRWNCDDEECWAHGACGG